MNTRTTFIAAVVAMLLSCMASALDESRQRRMTPVEVSGLTRIKAGAGTSGMSGIETRVATAYEKWVREKGNVFRLRDGVDGHHDTIKLRWEMLPADGGEVISVGFDFLVLGENGRIRTGYQFIEA